MKAIFLAIFIALIISFSAISKEKVKVAVIDTGIDIQDPRFKNLICGYRDFTGKGIEDHMGHGTHVAGIIKKYAKKDNFCLIILKYTDSSTDSKTDVVKNLTNLYYSLYEFQPDVVNFSGGGNNFLEVESTTIKDLKNTKFFVAAGNENQNIDVNPYYPASLNFPNVTPVGASNNDGSRASFSNWGNRVVWKPGVYILSTVPYILYSSGLLYMSGTSQSTARATGEYLNELH